MTENEFISSSLAFKLKTVYENVKAELQDENRIFYQEQSETGVTNYELISAFVHEDDYYAVVLEQTELGYLTVVGLPFEELMSNGMIAYVDHCGKTHMYYFFDEMLKDTL